MARKRINHKDIELNYEQLRLGGMQDGKENG